MKTAISLPDDLFAHADRLARVTRRSRSGLVADALREYLLRHDPDAVTAALDRVYAEAPPQADAFVAAAAARVLQPVDW